MVEPQVAISMCTFNGEGFITAQLESILAQTHKNWVLWKSDDGSSDQTLEILKVTQMFGGSDKLIIVKGPSQGFVRNC